jgi:DNA-directed RNA polymerase subunit alpha
MLIIQRPTVEALGEAENNSQRFAVGPLDPGFGHTLGNSLRRTLLSSIPGAAVTQVRFEDALHEFATIPGVKEDVTDIILNLKDLLLTVHSDDPVTLHFEKKGGGVATGADLQVTADVEVLNPDLVIATLNDKATLKFDLTVARGRGYVSAEKNKHSKAIGVIPIDSIFSPVRNVAFTVESDSSGRATDNDRLVLDIETDGSISPREALASAGETLSNLLSVIAGLEDAPLGLELGDAGSITQATSDLDLRIEDLDLTERPRNCLKRAQIDTVAELLRRSANDLLNITNFGQKSLDEILVKLDERGLSLKAED